MKSYILLIVLAICFSACGPKPPPDKFPFYKQQYSYDCAPTSLRMIYEYYGEKYSEEELIKRLKTDTSGTSLQAMHDLSHELGFTSMMVGVDMDFLQNEIKLPCIVHWNNNHAIVVYKADSTKIYVADPADTLLTYDRETFMKSWLQSDMVDKGIALVVYKL